MNLVSFLDPALSIAAVSLISAFFFSFQPQHQKKILHYKLLRRGSTYLLSIITLFNILGLRAMLWCH